MIFKRLAVTCIACLLVPTLPAYPSTKVVKAEVEFAIHHSIKAVKGLCKDIFVDQVRIQVGQPFRLLSPFVIVCDVKQMDTGSKSRDADMRKALSYPEFKKIIVEVSSFSPVDAQKKTAPEYIISGVISIAGEKRRYETRAKIKPVANQITATGGFALKLSDFNIEAPRFLLFKVEDKVDVRYRFVLSVK